MLHEAVGNSKPLVAGLWFGLGGKRVAFTISACWGSAAGRFIFPMAMHELRFMGSQSCIFMRSSGAQSFGHPEIQPLKSQNDYIILRCQGAVRLMEQIRQRFGKSQKQIHGAELQTCLCEESETTDPRRTLRKLPNPAFSIRNHSNKGKWLATLATHLGPIPQRRKAQP